MENNRISSEYNAVKRHIPSNVFIKNTKFFLMEVKYGKYYSQSEQKYNWFKSSKGQVWLHKDTPCSGINANLYEIVDMVPKDVSKDERWVVKSFTTTEFPLRERTPMEKHNMCIFVDLDLDKSEKLKHIFEHNKNIYNVIYENLDFAFRNFFEKNYMYAEQSSSKVGVHAIFGFDVEANEDNFHKLAKYVKNKIFDNVDSYIDGFTKVLNDVDSEGNKKVFDSIYDRPYQKYFITGVNPKFNDNYNGYIDLNELGEIKIKEKSADTFNYDIVSSDIKLKHKSLAARYDDRFFAATALKRVTKDKNEWKKLWWQICQVHYHSKRDTKWLFNEFNYDKLDETTGRVSILDKYGIKYNKSDIYHHLSENQFLGDLLPQILDETSNGVNMLISGTGTGKNHSWINYNRSILNDPMEMSNHRPILIVEPLNSIIESKYDKDECEIVKGATKFLNDLYSYKMFVTNFNKLLSKDVISGQFKLNDDIVEFLKQFELIIIDESHIAIKDMFRADVLIPFIETINKVGESTKVILQTATPAGEEQLFDIKNKITVTKVFNKNIKYIFRRFKNEFNDKKRKFNIQEVNCLAQYYINNGRKVYIYWNNASLQQLESFKSTYAEPNRVAIFHKKNDGEESMQYILENHELGDKYDILLSSVYFGVGNDLNDENDAAVIIIGNNMWQEDIQAIGRWRNSKDIEVCTILLGNDYDFLSDAKSNKSMWEHLFSHQFKILRGLWHDKQERDKSLIIRGKTYQIHKESDIRILAIMKTADIYYSSYYPKIEALKSYNIDVRENIDKFLECNDDYNERLKTYNAAVRNIRNENKRNIVEGNIDWDIINRDTKLVRFAKVFNQLKRYCINETLQMDFIMKSSNMDLFELFIRFYRSVMSGDVDYAELYSLLWYKSHYKEGESYVLLNNNIESDIYWATLAYVIFWQTKNKTDKDFNLKSNYFATFKKYCNLFERFPAELVTKFYDNTDYTNSIQFMESQGWISESEVMGRIKSMEDVEDKIVRMDKSMQDIYNTVKFCLNYNNKSVECSEAGKVGGKVGGKKSSPKKKCIITDKFKHPEKYNLNIGQEFESCDSLALHTGKSAKTITQWRNKGWVE